MRADDLDEVDVTFSSSVVRTCFLSVQEDVSQLYTVNVEPGHAMKNGSVDLNWCGFYVFSCARSNWLSSECIISGSNVIFWIVWRFELVVALVHCGYFPRTATNDILPYFAVVSIVYL